MRLRPGLIFKREAGPEIRRLFAGPLLPAAAAAARAPAGAAAAGRGSSCSACTAPTSARRTGSPRCPPDARGAYNIAADPVLDRGELGARAAAPAASRVPARAVRALADLTYRARLQPAPARLAGHGPGRADDGHAPGARASWAGRRATPPTQALLELLDGHARAAPACRRRRSAAAGGRFRLREFLTGVGGRL